MRVRGGRSGSGTSTSCPSRSGLLLEPSDNPAARSYKESIYEQGIAAGAFAVNDVQRDYERLKQLGVDFKMEPTDMGTTKAALFDDTCGT
jgi:glyoxalase/bleomycin resistance protein/dioxygenase superfamily protein